ncbi:MAG: PHP domain-containing protein [Solobacterium sp.]|nr:PHP domain-containing protein [Solobacterium sp.]
MHSCLSPCAEDEMTPNNICQMAILKGLEVIAVTDHNSTKQLASISEVAKSLGLYFIYGCELETIEEVHILGLFDSIEKTNNLQNWIDEHMPNIPNQVDYFGKQEIRNTKDEVIGIEDRLLIVSLDVSVEECVKAIHHFGGKAILAHVLDRKNSITHQLGFIPNDLPYDGLEIKTLEQKQTVLEKHPWIQEDSTVWFIDSDAHRLIDISEKENQLENQLFKDWWGIGV